MNEIAVRTSLPQVPTPESLGVLLGPYLLVDAVHADGWNGTLRIEGLLKPDRDARGPAAVRRSLLDSLDAAMAILEAAGAKWARHPMVFIAGDVIDRKDGSQGFARIEGRVTLDLLVPGTG